MSGSPSSHCVLIPKPLSAPRFRLVCFAHAGAGASTFHPWASAFGEHGVEVRAIQYPGHESRWGEPLLTSVSAMADHWLERWPEVIGHDDVPYVIYGHSMGVLVAYEIVLRLPTALRAPQHMILGGRNPPHIPSQHPPIHHLSDDEFIGKVADRYQNLPPEILADPDMRSLIIPVLKADFELVDTYTGPASESAGIAIPMTIVDGSEDPFTESDQMADWSRYTHSPCRVRRIDGGHFFHQEEVAQMVQLIRGLIE